MDIFYKLITNVDDGKNKELFYQALLQFDRDSLMGHEQENLTKALAPLLTEVSRDPVKKEKLLKTLDQHLKQFNAVVKEFELETASLYPKIKALVDKIYKTYLDALQALP